MSAQKDIISGKDLSAASTILQEDLMQAINQAAPLDNIGFIIVSTTRPDITNNPRFIRYLWLDISSPSNPQLKHYIGDRTALADVAASWTSITVEDLAVLTSSFAARSITGGVNVALLKLNADYSASAGSIYYVLRVAANGKDIEAVSLDQELLDGGGVALNRIQTTGLTAGKFIGFNGGVAGYVAIVPSTDLIGASRIAVETNVVPGTARFVARTNAAGVAPEWITPNGIFNDSELQVQKLLASGAAINDILRYNGTVWEKVTPSLRTVAGDAINSGIFSTAGGTGMIDQAVHVIPHGLTTVPKLIRVVAVNTGAAEVGWATNDEVEINTIYDAGAIGFVCVGADATNITITQRVTAGLVIFNKATGVSAGITEAQWRVKAYAWK